MTLQFFLHGFCCCISSCTFVCLYPVVRTIFFLMCNGPTNALVCNKTLIQTSNTKTLTVAYGGEEICECVELVWCSFHYSNKKYGRRQNFESCAHVKCIEFQCLWWIASHPDVVTDKSTVQTQIRHIFITFTYIAMFRLFSDYQKTGIPLFNSYITENVSAM
jgi:hypothetical protein